MVKIELEVPDWALGKNINIFANEELLARLEIMTGEDGLIIYKPIKIKPADGRCSGCGSCCEDGFILPPQKLQLIKEKLCDYEFDDNKPCPLLDPETGCVLGTSIPFACARAVCTHYIGCTERLE